MSMESEPTKADCYSAGERRWMEYGQRLRSRLLDPLLATLTRNRIVPDQVTLASLVLGLMFVPLWITGLHWRALLAIFLHVFLDGLDGPLARYQKIDSQKGSFTDSFCDQVIVTAVTITLMSAPNPMIGIWAGSLFMVLYVGVMAIAMVRNALRTPHFWLIRPRFFLFVAIPLELWNVPYAVSTVIWISNVLLGLKAISGFFKLRNRLPGPID